jgi:dihydrofolate reductase
MQPRVSIVAAFGKNREIGLDNRLLWYIPEDLKRFKRLTLGHPVVMGRKTFESIVTILGKPLPGRTNIVVTRDKGWAYVGATVAHSLEEALAKARELDKEEIFIGGGANLWEQALPQVDRLYLTLIDDAKPADTYFPPYEHLFTKKIAEESGEHEGLQYRWVDLEK